MPSPIIKLKTFQHKIILYRFVDEKISIYYFSIAFKIEKRVKGLILYPFYKVSQSSSLLLEDAYVRVRVIVSICVFLCVFWKNCLVQGLKRLKS